MELFGFEINRKKREAEQRNAPSFVAPVNDDGAQVIESSPMGSNFAGGQYLSSYIDMEGAIKSEIDLIQRYRSMSLIPECDAAVDDIVQEAIATNDLDNTVSINLDGIKNGDLSDNIKDTVRKEFEHILSLLRFRNTGPDLFRKWYIDGRAYFHLLTEKGSPKKGIQGLRYIDPMKIKKIREIHKKKDEKTGVEVIDRIEEYYHFSDAGFDKTGTNNSGQVLKISPDAVIMASSGMMDATRTQVIGYLHKALKAGNQLRMMEDALVIYRIARAPERRIFYIDVGNLPKVKAEQYLADTMTRYKNKLVYNADTGEIRDDRRHMSMLEDFWLPRREGGRGTEITTLPGGQNLGEIEDILYFQKKLYKALNVPISRLEADAQFSLGRASEITRDEVKFSRFVDKLRHKISVLFLDLLKTQLILKGTMSAEEFDKVREFITFDFQKDSHFVEMKEAEIYRERVNTLREMDEFVGKYYSQNWVRKNILRQSEDEIEIIDGEIEKDKESGDGEGEDDSFDQY